MAKEFNRYELRLGITDRDYLDSLIVALARQGYAPYISEDLGKMELMIEVNSEDMIGLSD